MTGGKIFVAGSLHCDIVVDAPVLPAKDETVMGGPIRFVCGGKGGNQAVAASLHGAEVAFGGMVGKDRFGDALLDHLREAGVNSSQVARTGETASGASVAIVDEAGDYGAVIASGANRLIDAGQLAVPDGTEYLVLQNEIAETANMSLANQARSAGAKIILNAAPWRPVGAELLGIVEILIINRVEAEGLFGRAVASVDQALSSLDDVRQPAGCTVVTLGAEGLVFAVDGDRPEHLPAFEVSAISTHGAGDAFIGAMCAELVRNRSLREALTYASAAAALHVSTLVDERMSIDAALTIEFMASAHRRS